MSVQVYCTQCRKMVTMGNPETVRLTSGSYIHRGRCTRKGCDNLLMKKVYDNELMVSRTGHKYPKTVYVGKDTPRKIYEDLKGQTVVEDGITLTKATNEIMKTQEQLKEEVNAKDTLTRTGVNATTDTLSKG